MLRTNQFRLNKTGTKLVPVASSTAQPSTSDTPKLQYVATPPIYIGIDPGANGGLAVLCGNAVCAVPMHRTELATWTWLTTYTLPPGKCCAAVEKVGGYIGGGPPCPVCKQARNRSPGSSMFEFGEGYGGIRMALIGQGLTPNKGTPALGTFHDVPPRVWQSGLKIDQKRKGENDTDWKNRLKWNAEQMFPKTRYPSLRVTLRTSDALLLATYLQRLHRGTI